MQRLVRIGERWVLSVYADDPYPKHEVLGGLRKSQSEEVEVELTDCALHRAE